MKNLRLLITIAVMGLMFRSAMTSAATVTTLYGFTGGSDGGQPLAGLAEGVDSNFFGTTSAGGLFSAGTVFTITPQGTVTTLHTFAGGADGANPKAGLVLGNNSNFFGTTFGGGLSSAGTVFQMTPSGTLTILYTFTGGADGGQPEAGLVQGFDGNFYGTTFGGGSGGLGTVFKVNLAGTLTTLWRFSGGVDGANPKAGLVQGIDSNFYGTTFTGGGNGSGTVYKISSAGTFTALWGFTGGIDGGQPSAGLVQASDGRFYGTCSGGGGSGLGAVFKIGPAGALIPLWNFSGNQDGANPQAGLIQAGDGNFYGTTTAGGSGGVGTIFKMVAGGTLTPLYSFAGGLDGASPQSGLVEGSVSNFYGTTSANGAGNAGTVFTLVQPCTYSLSPTRVTVPATAFSGTFTVTPGNTNCPWTAISNASWITITSDTNGIGDGTVAYSVAGNTNANVSSRVGTITVAGKIFTVTQQALVFGQFLQGTYNGLILNTNTPTQASSGFFSLVFSKTGSFAAKLAVGGASSSFHGQFDASGNATNTAPRAKLNSLQVSLHVLPVTDGTEQLTGTVSDGVFTSEILADLAVFNKVNLSPFVGRYTVVLAPANTNDVTVPQGFGYGTLTLSTTGSGKLQGTLGDGTKLNASAPVSGYGTWPLYNSLYKKQGSVIGWITIASNNTLTAMVDWFKPATPTDHFYPAGFTTAAGMTGAIYVSPTAGGPSIAGSGTLTLGGGNLSGNIVKSVVIDAQGKVTVSPSGPDKLTMKIQPTTGQLSGSFVNPAIGNKSIKFNGLLLQSDKSSAGFFLGTSQSGFVTLEPSP